jgi:hypothetical protein
MIIKHIKRRNRGAQPWIPGESVTEGNKEGYYLGLRRTQGTLTRDEPDFEPWLLFFLRSLKKQKDPLTEKIEREPGAEGLHPDAMNISEEVRTAGTPGAGTRRLVWAAASSVGEGSAYLRVGYLGDQGDGVEPR